MFQSGDQEKPTAEKVTFPLNKVYFPMRMTIFKTMKMDQLVQMAFESLEAAKDIRSAQISPKVLSIDVGHYRCWGVRFGLDDFSCIVGIKGALREKHMNEHLFVTKTFSGEVLDKCSSGKTKLYVIVPEKTDLIDAVKNVYKFLCDLFCEPKETNLVVRGEFAYLYPVINSIRKTTSLNRLEFYGDWEDQKKVFYRQWGSGEHQKELFEGILKTTTFNYLAIHDKPPVGSKPVKITADHVVFNMNYVWWLSEARLQEVDAKKIVSRPNSPTYYLGEQFISVLKSWHQGTGFQRLEFFTYDGFNMFQIGTEKEQLPMRQWNKSRRPGYYCDYKIGEDGEKKFNKFYDLRNAEDLTNQRGELGTIIVSDTELIFVVWTEKEVESVRDAYEHIEKARQMHNQKKMELEKELEGLNSRKRKYNHEARREHYARMDLAETITAIQRYESYMKIIEECA